MTNSILERVAAGEADAIDACIDRYGGLVWSLARRLCPTPSDAEDAVQEVFIELWRCAGRYDASVAAESTFIGTLARRRIIDRRRKLDRQPATQSLADAEDLPTTRDPATAELSEEAARVTQAMEGLSEPRRRVLELSILSGHSHDRISKLLDMPIGTVKSHARRGLDAVRETLSRTRTPETKEVQR